jgi:Protein of unknown function (DUF 659)
MDRLKMQHNSTLDTTGSIALSSINDSTPLWEYVTRIEKSENGRNTKFTCKFCKILYTAPYFWVKAHLLKVSGHGIRACSKVTKEEVENLKKLQDETEARAKAVVPKQVSLPSAFSVGRARETPNVALIPVRAKSGKRRVMTVMEKSWDVTKRNEVDEEIGREFYTDCSSFNFTKNSHFINSYVLLSNIGIQEYKPPSYDKIRTTFLDRERVHVSRLLEPIKSTWSYKGVSIICDGWTDIQRRPLINFIVITDVQRRSLINFISIIKVR